MKSSMKTRVFSLLLALVMVIGMVPMTVLAEDGGESEGATTRGVQTLPDGMTLVSDKESTLAPGVTEHQKVLYTADGNRVEMYVTVSDLSVETVHVYANYLDNQNDVLGMSKTTEQVAAAEAKHAEPYTVVAAINASYYNMITGKPTGTFVMEGNDITTESEGNNYSFFAILNDGTPVIGAKGEYSSYKGQIAEAVGGYIHLVHDGAICSGLNSTTKYPRQTVGITADGKVITMTADGNQAPKSSGLTVQEQAEVMLALGCVEAVHLDGGGSTTYCSKPEGSDTIQVINSPSDGSERSVSNSLMIVSTAVADGTFDHAVLTAEHNYVTPGSNVSVATVAVDAAGGSAELPEDISWQLADETMGTVVNGVFTSNGTVGDAVVQMVWNNNVVGETVIHVVIPETISFKQAELVVPYGKNVTLEMVASYGINEVFMKNSDVIFTLSDAAMGTVDGFSFTTCAEDSGITCGIVSAALSFDASVTATVSVTFGKGSEVVYDFEDGTNQNVYFNETPGTKYNYVWTESEQFIATADNGQVHSGSYALGATVNYANSLESGYMRTSLYATETRVFENAVSIGAWIYISDECDGLWARWTLKTVSGYDEEGNPVFGSSLYSNTMDITDGGTGVVSTFYEPGWHYLSADTSNYNAVGWIANGAMIQFYISDRDGSAYNYTAAENSNIPSKYVFYIDDITVDYSSAVDDREAPTFSNLTYAVEGMPDAAALDGNTITTNKVTFAVSLEENTSKSNYSGLDESTIRAYVDGVACEANFANGKVSINDLVLSNGKHTIKFSACDRMGNYSCIYQYITVAAEESNSTVKLVPTDASLTYPKLGSIYNMDLVATAIEDVKSVEVVIDLDNNSTWQLDHMTLAEGFEASYAIDETENVATLVITRTGENTQTGEAALATLPVRVWSLKTGYTYANGTKAGQAAFTLAQFKSMKEFWRMSVIATVDKGILTRTDATVDTFTGERVFCDTEMWGNYAKMTATEEGLAYYNAWDGGHVHVAETVDALASTCTKAGYTGRTYCSICESVVDWGTTIEATGHTFESVEGILECSCGEIFNGVYEDGKTYVDGIEAQGWIDDSYYVDGVVLTGIQNILAPDASGEFYYDFGEDGICTGKYSGIFEKNGNLYYAILGTLTVGWQTVGEDLYYFSTVDYAALDGVQTIGSKTYEFENCILIDGHWSISENGIYLYWGAGRVSNGWKTIKGKTYYFWYGYATVGARRIESSTGAGDGKWYLFDENGVFIEMMDGLYDGIYYQAGEKIPYLGLIKYEGYFYYVGSNGEVIKNKTYYITNTNGLTYDNGVEITKGSYTFDEEGRMVLKNGLIDGHYYVDNVLTSYAGLIKQDGYFYYIGGSAQPIKNRTYFISKTNGLTYDNGVEITKGSYTFDEEGRMVLKNGLIDGHYYVDNVLTSYAGLIKQDGYFYYIGGSAQPIKNRTYFISKTNGLTYDNGVEITKGSYTFDEEGRMVLKNGLIDGHYYVDNVLTSYAGLIKQDGYFYYIGGSAQPIKNKTYYVSNTNGLTWDDGTAIAKGNYTFDAEGKMVIE